MKKHLIYYIYPANKGMLLFNLRLLHFYYIIFTGSKHCVIATDQNSMSFLQARNLVCEFLPGIVIHKRKNNRTIGETAHFTFLLSHILHEPGITFYAHAKGVCRQQPDMRPVKKWIEKLYESNLSAPNLDDIFTKFKIAGSFRVNVYKPTVNVNWHYSGTFFWLKNDALLSINWQETDQIMHGVEAFPGKHFLHGEGYCIAFDDAPNLYKAINWHRLNIPL